MYALLNAVVSFLRWLLVALCISTPAVAQPNMPPVVVGEENESLYNVYACRTEEAAKTILKGLETMPFPQWSQIVVRNLVPAQICLAGTVRYFAHRVVQNEDGSTFTVKDMDGDEWKIIEFTPLSFKSLERLYLFVLRPVTVSDNPKPAPVIYDPNDQAI